MSWMMHHSSSAEYATQAELAFRRGSIDEAQEYYRLAAEQEMLALADIDQNKTKTLGITAVSAASLWYKAREYRQAERVAHQWLVTDLLPEFAANQLQKILQTLWNEEHFQQLGIEFVEGEVLVAVSGGQIAIGGAPLELIYSKVGYVSNIFYRTVEMMLGRPSRSRGGPNIEIKEQFRPWLIQAPAASYQFAVRVQKPSQMSLFPGVDPEVEAITRKFLDIVGAASQETHEKLEEIVPDQEYRKAFLKLARNLAPTEKTTSFDRLEIKSATDPTIQPIIFVPFSRRDINRTLRTFRRQRDTDEHLEDMQLTGVLRALHLDKDWLEVKLDDVEDPIRIDQTGDVIDDLVGPMVNNRVIVSVGKKPNGKYVYHDIESEE